MTKNQEAFALLIDADNTSLEVFSQIMKHVEKWGKVTIRQVYGNQETLLNQKWKDACLRYALQPLPHVGISGAKNATDIALAVGAMDLLYQNVAKFCLVTGDQDFTALILRLRNQGCQVYCIGRPSKAATLPKVCTEFCSIEQREAVAISKTEQTQERVQKEALAQSQASGSHHDPALTLFFTQAMQQMVAKKNLEWILFPQLGSCMKQLDPTFQAKAYGKKSLLELIKHRTDLFEMRRQGDHIEVRLKEKKAG